MYRIYGITLIFLLTASICWALGPFTDHLQSEKIVGGKTSEVVSKNSTQDVNIIKFKTDKLDLIFTLTKPDIIQVSGTYTANIKFKDLEKYLEKFLLTHTNILAKDVLIKGYLYTTYGYLTKTDYVSKDTERFISLKHLMCHLYNAIEYYLNDGYAP